jgi:probable rRNA maturation factor
MGFVARSEKVRLADVDVAVVDRRQIAALNRRYRRRAGRTDVLSFDLSDPGQAGISAQIVVCGDVAAQRAAARGGSKQRELMLYVLHGLLHLVGYEDDTVHGAARMHARQDELLEAFERRRRPGAKQKG